MKQESFKPSYLFRYPSCDYSGISHHYSQIHDLLSHSYNLSNFSIPGICTTVRKFLGTSPSKLLVPSGSYQIDIYLYHHGSSPDDK